jgi:glycosyltransferase involved in cell wall biosynthesis
LKVLHVVNSADTGGAQTLIEALGHLLSVRGVQTYVVVLLGRDSLSDRLDSASRATWHLDIGKSPFALGAGVRGVRRVIRELKPDVVHSHLLQANLVSALASVGVPHLATIHSSGGHESGPTARLVTRLLRLVRPGIDEVIACSESAAGFAARSLRLDVAGVILNGTDPSRFREATTRGSQILCLSRWHPMKDHRTLFDAVSRLPGAPLLTCAGAGMDSDNPELAALARDFPRLNVQFLGPINDVEDELAKSAALVISSSHGEALPMAGIEALFAGVPVVTTDVGDCRSLAVDPSLLVRPQDPEALAEAMERALASELKWPERARKLAATKFDARVSADRYHAIYAGLIEARD